MKKIDWNDKQLITEVVLSSKTWREAIERLGLKYVSGNIKTLKKYAAAYGVTVNKPVNETNDKQESQESVDQTISRNRNNIHSVAASPKIVIVSEIDDAGKARLEIDWNPQFILALKQHGFADGEVDEEMIIIKWLKTLANLTIE